MTVSNATPREGVRPTAPRPTVGIDRIRCTGHGVCADLLPEIVTLDEHGYPIVAPGAAGVLSPRDLDTARRLCPARALHRRG